MSEATASAIGFCEKCGIVREDGVVAGRRVAVTDCPCTAVVYGHAESCGYTKLCGSPVTLDGCAAHGRFPCEGCDCTCEKQITTNRSGGEHDELA